VYFESGAILQHFAADERAIPAESSKSVDLHSHGLSLWIKRTETDKMI